MYGLDVLYIRPRQLGVNVTLLGTRRQIHYELGRPTVHATDSIIPDIEGVDHSVQENTI